MKANRTKRLFGFISAISLAFCVPIAQAGDGCGAKAKASACSGAKDIVDTAVSAGSFKTLAAAIKAAGLAETLKGKGPFTVFAPTDEAFAKLPEGTVEGLLKNPPKLRQVLKHHVVAGNVAARDVVKVESVKTLIGQTLPIDASDGVKVGSAKVSKADVACSNGVIHVIDTVLLPKDDILDVAGNAGSFKTLLKAVEAAGLSDTLRGEGPFTVFAPTDEAFAKLPKGTLEGLLKDLPKLKRILLYHVVPGKHLAADVVKMDKAKTAEGQSVRIRTSDGVKVDDANVVKTDVHAANGVIHVIDAVILPH